MKLSFSKILTALLLGVLALYGIASTLFTARDLGDTFDEATYREAGLAYLSRLDFRNNRDHPPLSKWLSSLYPYLSGDHSIFAFRLTHSILFLLGGLTISILLFRKRSRIAALTFAAFYFLCPNINAMA
jgi:4-amino-4-deoxy-L-arabinose transferase-like glycosyltransferase